MFSLCNDGKIGIRLVLGSLLLCGIFALPGFARAAEPVDADLLLVGGTIHVGDGSEATVGDIAIRGDRIVAIGEFETGEIKKQVDCSGLIVAPGFIDLHNHSDGPLTNETSHQTRGVANYLTQGCTTIVTGNCGSGPVDVGGYYDELDQYGIGTNVAHLLPQGSLRRKVMQSQRRSASAEELDQMRKLATKAMEDGAWGMSSGLIYVPSSYADTQELTEIAKVIAKHQGVYASHIRGEGTGLLDSVQEALKIGRDAGVPVHISHFKSSGKESWGLVRVAIDLIRKERESGAVVTADQYPYVASSTSLSATFFPAWSREGGREKTLQRLAGGADAERIRAAINKKLESTDQGQRIQIAMHKPQPTWAGRRLKSIAAEQNLSPFDLIVAIEKNGGASVVNFGINEEDVRYVMRQPWVATASDGSARIPSEEIPHPRSYGTFSRKIGYYCERENVISLEQAIRSSSGLPADILGLEDRGYLKTGFFADIAIWDKDSFIDRARFEEPDRYSDGIRFVFVNGKPAVWHGNVTGALSGRALRHDIQSKKIK